MQVKMSFGKWQPFCLGHNVLRSIYTKSTFMHLPIIQHAGCRIQIKHFNYHPVCYPYLCKPISPAQIFSVVLYNSLEAVTYAELLLTVFVNILRAEQYKRGDIMLATLNYGCIYFIQSVVTLQWRRMQLDYLFCSFLLLTMKEATNKLRIIGTL